MAKFMVSKTTEAGLVEIFTDYTKAFSRLGGLRKRFEKIDKYVQRTNEKSDESAKAQQARRAGKSDKIPNLELPICFPQLDAAHAELVGTFCTGYPVFAFVADVAKQDSAKMLTSLVARDQERFNWISELMVALHNALKYNFAPMDIDWTKQQQGVLTNQAGQTIANLEQYQGNAITAIDPYNFFFDTTVRPDKLHTDGCFAGYVERKHYIGLKRFIQGLNPDFLLNRNITAAFKNSSGVSNYFVPDIHSFDAEQFNSQSWDIYYGMSRHTKNAESCGKYELTKMYVRIVPKDFDIAVARAGTPAIFKLYFIGGILIYCEPLTNAHGCIPIIIGRGYADLQGFQNKTFVENIQDMQDAGSAILNASLNSLRRSIADRAIFNPLLLDEADVRSGNPVAKMAIKVGTFNGDLKNAYMPIPYTDSTSGYMQQNLNTVVSLANGIHGVNQAAQGNFVKGNKTLHEYSDVMQNSNARIAKFALNLEYTLMMPLRQLIKLNYMQYAKPENVPSAVVPGQMQKIDPASLIAFQYDFKGTDGIMPVSKVVNGEVIGAAINAIAQMPELDMEFSRGKMFTYLMSTQSLDLAQFARTPEEKAQYQQQQIAMAQAAQQGKSGA